MENDKTKPGHQQQPGTGSPQDGKIQQDKKQPGEQQEEKEQETEETTEDTATGEDKETTTKE